MSHDLTGVGEEFMSVYGYSDVRLSSVTVRRDDENEVIPFDVGFHETLHVLRWPCIGRVSILVGSRLWWLIERRIRGVEDGVLKYELDPRRRQPPL